MEMTAQELYHVIPQPISDDDSDWSECAFSSECDKTTIAKQGVPETKELHTGKQ